MPEKGGKGGRKPPFGRCCTNPTALSRCPATSRLSGQVMEHPVVLDPNPAAAGAAFLLPFHSERRPQSSGAGHVAVDALQVALCFVREVTKTKGDAREAASEIGKPPEHRRGKGGGAYCFEGKGGRRERRWEGWKGRKRPGFLGAPTVLVPALALLLLT